MDFFNSIITNVFDILCAPFAGLDPWWGLSTLSVLTGIVMLIIFRFTSNQEGIRRTKNTIKAYVLEARLFNDDLGLMFSAQKNILRTTVTYMRHSLTPMLFLMVPVVLIMVQLSVRFDRFPLLVGESAVVKVSYEDGTAFDENVTLVSPEGIEVETAPVRIREKGEVLWRVKALEEGSFDLTVVSDSNRVTKKLIVSTIVDRLSVKRVGSGFLQQLVYPAELSIPAETGIVSIEVFYPSINYSFLGWSLHWLVIFFILSIVAGFAFKGTLRVEV